MSDEKIPVPKDEVNDNLLCCFPTGFPTRSWSGERINRCQVVKKSFDNEGEIFILRLKDSKLLVTLTKDLIKSLHTKKVDTYGFVRFMDLENEKINGYRVVNKSYVENGPSFVLNLHGQVEPITLSKDLVESLHAMTEPKADQLQDSI